MAWASHVGITSMVVRLESGEVSNLAHCVHNSLRSLPRLHVYVEVPLSCDPQFGEIGSSEICDGKMDKSDPWEWWNKLRCMSSHHNGLGVVVELTEDLPEERHLDRWVAEPLRLLAVPTSLFLVGPKGLPELPHAHAAFLKKLMCHSGVQFLVRGAPKHAQGLSVYVQYLAFLKTSIPPLTEQEKFEYPYRDYLQVKHAFFFVFIFSQLILFLKNRFRSSLSWTTWSQ